MRDTKLARISKVDTGSTTPQKQKRVEPLQKTYNYAINDSPNNSEVIAINASNTKPRRDTKLARTSKVNTNSTTPQKRKRKRVESPQKTQNYAISDFFNSSKVIAVDASNAKPIRNTTLAHTSKVDTNSTTPQKRKRVEPPQSSATPKVTCQLLNYKTGEICNKVISTRHGPLAWERHQNSAVHTRPVRFSDESSDSSDEDSTKPELICQLINIDTGKVCNRAISTKFGLGNWNRHQNSNLHVRPADSIISTANPAGEERSV